MPTHRLLASRLQPQPPCRPAHLGRWLVVWAFALLLLGVMAATPASAQAPVPASLLGAPVLQTATGYYHTCALTAAGAVHCWGRNRHGQLGDGSTTDASTPQPVTGLSSGVVAIAANGDYNCALTSAGAVLCWGDNGYGQLGNGSTGGSTPSTPQTVTGLSSGVVAIAAGTGHSCALTTAGAVLCWGFNGSGQLGNGSNTDARTPQPVTGLSSGVAAIATGFAHSCALTQAGAMQCWGDNYKGQLGNGGTAGANTPQAVTGLAGSVAAMAAGMLHTCAQTVAGAVQCWGNNDFGQLGNGGSTDASTPQGVTGLAGGVAAIATKSFHTCALTTGGALRCWGSNLVGQVGNGSADASFDTPQAVTGLASGGGDIAAGASHTCAVTTAGVVQCWGSNEYGQLGDGSTTDSTTPRPVAVLAGRLVLVKGGDSHNCAVTSAGGLYCWGNNAFGQLGNGTRSNISTTPYALAGLSGPVASVAAGQSHTCAVTTAGAVHCWGRNTYGQVGDGVPSGGTTNSPTSVVGLPEPVQSITAGEGQTCALTASTGAVYCWGYNLDGTLGNGSTTHANTAQAVTGLTSGVKGIAAGLRHVCAITSADAVVCWGNNGWGQVGDGSMTLKFTTPQAVSGLAEPVAAISAGFLHTCALTTAGAVKCWGANVDGELGNGTYQESRTPVDVSGLSSGVAALATSAEHQCALTTAGAVKCWGRNDHGQVGVGFGIEVYTPIDVPGLGSGVQAIMAGGQFTCALMADGGLRCWGYNHGGQLGNGTTGLNSNPPTPAVAAQAIDFPAPTPMPAQGTSSTVLTATAGSGMGVQFESWTPNVCTVAGNALTVLPGTIGHLCGVRAYQPGGTAADGAGYVSARPQARLLVVQARTPDAPTGVAATASDAQATVGWTAPANDGGHPITGYTATAVQDGSKTCSVTTGSPLPTTCAVNGLANGTAYTFTVKATNLLGDSAASAASAVPVTPATVPGAPTGAAAVAGNAQATVAWTAPASNGGSAITAYTVVAVGHPTKTCTVTSGSPLPTTCTVTGLANGTAYAFTVKATNVAGDGAASAASAPATPFEPPSGGGAANLPVTAPGSTVTITDPSLPIVVSPGADGATIVLPGSGTTPVRLQLSVNGQPLTVTALPGTALQVAKVNGQTVLVLVVLRGWASMTSTSAGQPMALAGQVLLSSGSAGTSVEAQPLAVAVITGTLMPPAGSLPELGGKGLQAGEKLLVDAAGKLVAIIVGSLKGDTSQPGDPMAFFNLPSAITVDKAFARLGGPLARLSGASLGEGLEATASGVYLLRDGGQVLQLLPTWPIGIDATLPDGMAFTPLGLLRWVRGGVVVQFAPAVADLAGLASAITALLPDAQTRLGAEGALQLRTGGHTYVLKPGWTGAGAGTGTPLIGVDEQGRIFLQVGAGARQLLLPALLSHTQANAIFQAALPGATLAVQAASNEGAFTVALAGQSWRLVPQWVLPEGAAAQAPTPSAIWWLGADGLLYLKLGSQVQGVRVAP